MKGKGSAPQGPRRRPRLRPPERGRRALQLRELLRAGSSPRTPFPLPPGTPPRAEGRRRVREGGPAFLLRPFGVEILPSRHIGVRIPPLPGGVWAPKGLDDPAPMGLLDTAYVVAVMSWHHMPVALLIGIARW
ncbi:hypothetical protein VULLAG_LOCUS23235 [Vulpes lagopus]